MHSLLSLAVRATRTLSGVLVVLAALIAVARGDLIRTYDFSGDRIVFSQDTINDTIYDVVEMPGYNLDWENVGAPQLPLRTVFFIIPFHDKLAEVTAVVSEAETLDGPYYPKPVQPPGCSICSPQPFYPPVSYYYDYGYPLGHVDGEVECFQANYRLASFNLRPLVWLPDGRLVKARTLTVLVQTAADPAGFGGLVPQRRSLFCDEELRRLVESQVENPEDVWWAFPVPIQEPWGEAWATYEPSLDGNPVSCLIIAEEASVPCYERYAQFWTERGVFTVVRPL